VDSQETQDRYARIKSGIKLSYITNKDYSSVTPLIEKEYYKLVAFDKSLVKGNKKRRRYVE
jgi:hypothetical protein